MFGFDKNIFFHTILFCYVTFTSSQCTEFNLKIEYNETVNKNKAGLDTFVSNRLDEITEGTLHLESNSDKPNITTKSKHENVNTEYILTVSEESRLEPFIKSEASDMKLKLNDLTMVKREYFQPTPSFEYPKKINEAKNYEGYQNFRNYNDLRFHNELITDSESYKNNHLYKDVSRMKNYKTNEIENDNFENTIVYVDKINNGDNQGILNLFSHPEMTQILKKQTELIEDLENYLRFQKLPLRSDFDDLLDSVEIKKNRTTTDTSIPERITDTTKAMLPTVTAVIDETAVRTALKKDPFVQRILKMANRKRELYMKHAKKYYKNMVYT